MFPDIANVGVIRDALWRHKTTVNASVMIGSGFSRNADLISPSARSMPNWKQMAEALCEPLYGGDSNRLNAALQETLGTSGFLRLAQEYQTAFGLGALNAKIREIVPDNDYRPSDLHKRLLRLCWADVFSTNWDTLLERSCPDALERSYDVVRTIEDIPYATRPRIVKLHGTFPGHAPFISTEEDYRTYPVRFAPFVNLVQQSMMETTFCLLGFSGDDPNFLHWSGWVRDNLGESAPKIYLVGWLELSAHRRRMLEQRNVMPIDLSALPQAKDWPRAQRHRYATDWFLNALEAGEPYDNTSWPAPKSQPPLASPHLRDIPHPEGALTVAEPFAAPPEASNEERRAELLKTVGIWAHNRRLYPGWLIAPTHVRDQLWTQTTRWLPEINAVLPKLSAFETLQVLSELAWRLNRCLFPFLTDFEIASYAAIESVNRISELVGGAPIPGDYDWSDLLFCCHELALALARRARHVGDSKGFERALAYLAEDAIHNADARHAMHYERCLWALNNGQLHALNVLLDSWVLQTDDTLWLMRKAGLLAEMRDHKRACAVLEMALTQIRRTRRRDIDDIVSMSRESWSLFLALAYSPGRSFGEGSELSTELLKKPSQRWRELAVVECDAVTEYQTLTRQLQYAPMTHPNETRRRGFDVDAEGVTYHLSSGVPEGLRAAYAMMFLADETGIPPSANHGRLFLEGLAAGARALAKYEPWLAISVAVRTGDKAAIEDVFSRKRIAAMPEALILRLHDNVYQRATYGLSVLGAAIKRDFEGEELTTTAIEVWSRVALRLPGGRLVQLWSEAAACYRSPTVRRLSILLGEPVSNLMGRILEALPSDELQTLLPQIFALPLVNEPGLLADEFRLKDAVALLPEGFKPAEADTSLPTSAEWPAIIARLIDAARGPDHPNRSAATFRLFKLWKWGWLNLGEVTEFARELWAPDQLAENGLPAHTRFMVSLFLTLPAPPEVDRKERVTQYIIRLVEEGKGDVNQRLEAIGLLFDEADRTNMIFDLPNRTKNALVNLVDVWASMRPSLGLPTFFTFPEDRNANQALRAIGPILVKVEIHEEIKVKILNKVDELDAHRESSVHAYPLYPYLMRLFPDSAEKLILRIRHALGSDDEREARSAAFALYKWTQDGMQLPDQIKLPEQDLFREIGIAIAARRTAILRSALDIARWLFADGPQDIARTLVTDCQYGLDALYQEASYERGDSSFDVPSIRAACVRLAGAMEEAGFCNATINAWIKVAENDPLPEVRFALSRRVE